MHWAVRAGIKAKARRDAAYATYAAMQEGARSVRLRFAGDGPIGFKVTFYPPDARHRDDDNMIGGFKAARDGIADALGVNDRRFKAEYVFADPCKPGRVEVVLTALRLGDKNLSPDSQCSVNGGDGPSGATTPPARDPVA